MATWPEPRASQEPHGWSDPAGADAGTEFLKYRALVSRVVDAFGDEVKASRWLSIPSRDLNGMTPLEAARRAGYDPRIIEPILTRIEHGVDY